MDEFSNLEVCERTRRLKQNGLWKSSVLPLGSIGTLASGRKDMKFLGESIYPCELPADMQWEPLCSAPTTLPIRSLEEICSRIAPGSIRMCLDRCSCSLAFLLCEKEKTEFSVENCHGCTERDFSPVGPCIKNGKSEIWPQRPRYFAAAIAMQYVREGVAQFMGGGWHIYGGGLTLVLTSWLMASGGGWHL